MKLQEVIKKNKGFTFIGVYRVARFEIKKTRGGKDYGDCLIGDGQIEIAAKFWDITPDKAKVLQENVIVKINTVLDFYRETAQLLLMDASVPSAAEREQALADLGLGGGQVSEENERRLAAVIAGVEQADLRRLLEYIFGTDSDFGARFKRHPGAVRNHHAGIGGLLEHTLEITDAVEDICRRDGRVNRDILMAAALLHDIGKVDEIAIDELGLPTGFTKEGKLLRHIYLGMERVEKACLAVQADSETALMMKHCILSHHGQAEWGSPVEPMTLEAQVLHYLDNISAKIEQFSREAEAAESGGFVRSMGLKRDIYKTVIE
mgnify:CR=1 FL=1